MCGAASAVQQTTAIAGEPCTYTDHTYIVTVSIVDNKIVTVVYHLGIYISQSSYIRHGERSLDGFYKPFHSVVYYRYLRFFTDGKCWVAHVHRILLWLV